MILLKRLILILFTLLVFAVVAFNFWGFATLGTLEPGQEGAYDRQANKVVLVSGANGSVGDGLLKAAMEAPDVEKIYALTRRTSPRIDAGVESGRITLIMHNDFTDYSALAEQLAEVNTVLWGLGTSSLNVDDETFKWIHVDFPVAFVKQWLAARTEGPMAFHYVTGMGTDADGDAHWAREKGRAEIEVAELAYGTGLRTFGYRSGYIKPPADVANVGMDIVAALLRPGGLVIDSQDLAGAMFEISARIEELPNGTLIDNVDSIRYGDAYRKRHAP
ncbi:MAG: hypothetical protein AAGF57_03715 [Pseudomonadota bacterium]